MKKPNVFNVSIRTRIVPPTDDEMREGARYGAIAKVKVTPYGSFEARSCGRTQAAARKFAQGFVLNAVAEAIINGAGTLETAAERRMPAVVVEVNAEVLKRLDAVVFENQSAKLAFDGVVGYGLQPPYYPRSEGLEEKSKLFAGDDQRRFIEDDS